MPLTNYSLNHFVAQELADLTAPTAKPLGPEFTDTAGWLSRLVLNSIFIRPMPLGATRLAFAWVRRAKAAIEAYDQGYEALHRLTGTLRRGHVVSRPSENVLLASGQSLAARLSVDFLF